MGTCESKEGCVLEAVSWLSPPCTTPPSSCPAHHQAIKADKYNCTKVALPGCTRAGVRTGRQAWAEMMWRPPRRQKPRGRAAAQMPRSLNIDTRCAVHVQTHTDAHTRTLAL